MKTWVNSQIDKKHADFVGAAPEQLDTLNELAAALANDPNFAATITAELAKKANKSDILVVPTPDWNAQEGQRGYINNKPFGKFKVNGELYVVSSDPYICNVNYLIPQEPNIIDLYPSKKVDYIRVYWSEGDIVIIDEIINIPDGVTSLKAIKYVNETPLGNFSLEFEKTESEIWVYLTAQDELFSVLAGEVLDTISVEAITCLPEEYIPDTIAREDESMRILRYISNPHIINMSGSPSERAIPKELYDAETDSFKMFGFSHDYPFVMIDHYGTVCPIYFDRVNYEYIPIIWTVGGGKSLIEISNGIVSNINESY